MFKRNKIKIIKDLYLDKPLQECKNVELDFFDREGYQLNGLEKEYHAVNEVSIHTEDRMARRVSDDALNVVLQHWYTQIEDHPNIFIDHAHILHRFGFAGEAREQLINEAIEHPKLYITVNIEGFNLQKIDFCLDDKEPSNHLSVGETFFCKLFTEYKVKIKLLKQ